MDRLNSYQNIVKEILTDYYQINQKAETTTETALAFDDIHHQYLLLLMGWQKDERIKSVMIHIRLKDDKIWIEEDWTEEGIITDLLAKGITTEEIVLAFHPPHVRQYSEFATSVKK